MAEVSELKARADLFPAGHVTTLTFARELLASPTGFPIADVSRRTAQIMQAGGVPSPHALDLLVASGLVVAENGYAWPTPALTTAAALFDGGE